MGKIYNPDRGEHKCRSLACLPPNAAVFELRHARPQCHHGAAFHAPNKPARLAVMGHVKQIGSNLSQTKLVEWCMSFRFLI
jgi:hypothetical protein